jgi:hypothetical protein
MITVRIAHARPWPGYVGDGKAINLGFLVVLADDAGHRAMPVWLLHDDRASGHSLRYLLEEPQGVTVTAGVPEELGARLLRAAGATVTGVDVDMTAVDADELATQTATARIEVASPAGPRQVTARLGLGLAVAAAAGAPVRVTGEVLDRFAIPVAGDDLLGPILNRIPPDKQWARPGPEVHAGPAAGTSRRPRFEPRNLTFADGLDRWDLDLGADGEVGDQDYTAASEGGSAVLAAAVPQPAGSAALMQTISADDYRGNEVVCRGEIRAEAVAQWAWLRLEIFTRSRQIKAERGDRGWQLRPEHEEHTMTISGSTGWARHEISARVPGDTDAFVFGVFLTGPGQIELRDAGLTRGRERS